MCMLASSSSPTTISWGTLHGVELGPCIWLAASRAQGSPGGRQEVGGMMGMSRGPRMPWEMSPLLGSVEGGGRDGQDPGEQELTNHGQRPARGRCPSRKPWLANAGAGALADTVWVKQ